MNQTTGIQATFLKLETMVAGFCFSLAILLMNPALAESIPPDMGECKTNNNIQNKAMNCPDQFAWEVFVRISKPLPGGTPTWHSYATDSETFPNTPVPSVCDGPEAGPDYCPTWPAASRPLAVQQQGGKKSSHQLPTNSHLTPFLSNVELVQRNKASFDYIVDHDLWYQQGLANSFTTGFEIDFPVASIEIKTNWIDLAQVPADTRGTFHRVKYDGKDMGLVAMHITTKDLPKWFWATFEHVDNPGRCDWLSCRDSFGVTPAVTKARKPLYDNYQAEEIKPALGRLLDGIDPVFQHYRLKGSQVDFVDETGNPRLLGNSVTEFGFIQNASCMTCHARATVNWKGQNGFGGFGNTPGDQPVKHNLPTAGTVAPQQSFSGAPDPRWFSSAGGEEQLHTMDFLWAMPFKANAAYETIKAAKATAKK